MAYSKPMSKFEETLEQMLIKSTFQEKRSMQPGQSPYETTRLLLEVYEGAEALTRANIKEEKGRLMAFYSAQQALTKPMGEEASKKVLELHGEHSKAWNLKGVEIHVRRVVDFEKA